MGRQRDRARVHARGHPSRHPAGPAPHPLVARLSSASAGPTSPATSRWTATSSRCSRALDGIRDGPTVSLHGADAATSVGGPPGSPASLGRPLAAAARGDAPARPTPLAGSRPPGGEPPLRRRQRVLRHRPRPGDDLLVRPVLVEPAMSLAEAQADKHELICRKLGLHEAPGRRLLDVGCGWGSLAMHAAQHHQARVVGITISREQADAGPGARGRPPGSTTSSTSVSRTTGSSAARSSTPSRRSACSSTSARSACASTSRCSAASSGHRGACSTTPSRAWADLGSAVARSCTATCSPTASSSTSARSCSPWSGPASRCATSSRSASTTRCTLRCWVANLEAAWDRAVELVGANRARVWLLYMAASALGFEDGGLDLHQVLGVRARRRMASSGMPTTRTTGRRAMPVPPPVVSAAAPEHGPG